MPDYKTGDLLWVHIGGEVKQTSDKLLSPPQAIHVSWNQQLALLVSQMPRVPMFIMSNNSNRTL